MVHHSFKCMALVLLNEIRVLIFVFFMYILKQTLKGKIKTQKLCLCEDENKKLPEILQLV